jgi:hypothetical protein
MTLVSIVLFIIPALIISLCYAIIVKTIWEKGTYMGPKDRRKNGRNGNADDDDRGSRRASSRGIIPRAKVKTVKMTFVIVIVFIACWSPYIIFDLLQVFDQIPKTQTNIAIATFIQSLAPLNSAANPLIYCLFSAQVWKTLRYNLYSHSLDFKKEFHFIYFIKIYYKYLDELLPFYGFRKCAVARKRSFQKVNLRMGGYEADPEIFIKIMTR